MGNCTLNFDPDSDACFECGENEESYVKYHRCQSSFKVVKIDLEKLDFGEEDKEPETKDVFDAFKEIEERDKHREVE